MPTANKILNSDDNMNELENEFSPVEPSHKTADAVQMDCNLLRDFVALAFRLTVPGFLICELGKVTPKPEDVEGLERKDLGRGLALNRSPEPGSTC